MNSSRSGGRLSRIIEEAQWDVNDGIADVIQSNDNLNCCSLSALHVSHRDGSLPIIISRYLDQIILNHCRGHLVVAALYGIVATTSNDYHHLL